MITGRNSSCGKVMFLHLSVILPPTRDGHYSGRYASYWNAFLFIYSFESIEQDYIRIL